MQNKEIEMKASKKVVAKKVKSVMNPPGSPRAFYAARSAQDMVDMIDASFRKQYKGN